jgi:fibronectin-binding autotransporter adhesin
MKKNLSRIHFVLAAKVIAAILTIVALGTVSKVRAAEKYWRTDSIGDTWTNLSWGTSAGGPFTNGWTANDNATFNAISTITNVTITTNGNVTVNADTTLIAAGTYITGGNIRTMTIASGATLIWNSQNVSSAVGTGFIKNGGGTWNIGGMSSGSAPGGFTLNDGTVIASTDNGLGNGLLTINGGIWESSGGRAYNSSGITIGGNFTLTGTGNAVLTKNTNSITLGASTRTITNSTTSGSRQFTGIISGGAGAGLTFAGTGGAQIYIGNISNTFDGPITINGAEVVFNDNGAFGSSTSITLDGGRLTMGSMSSGGNVSALTAATISSDKNIFVGAGAGTAISISGGTGGTTYNGIITDKPSSTGTWAKQGAGTLALGGPNTYSGGTFINNGTLQLTGGDNRLPAGTTLSLGQAADKNVGTFDLNGNNQQIAGLNSTAGTNIIAIVKNLVTNSAATLATLTISNSAANSYGDGSTTNSGIITGAINLIKTGLGTQILGDTNTYTGTTTVNSGILALSGKGSIGSSPIVSLGAGATIDVSTRTDGILTLTSGQTLNGFGTVTGKLVSVVNSTIAPGNPTTTGMLTISSNATLNGTNILKLYKTGGTNDVLSAGGILTYGGTLTVTNLSGTLAAGDSFKLFNAANYQGSFSATNLPVLSAGLSWTNTFGTDGKLSILGSPASVSYMAINSISLSGTNLVLGGTNQGAGISYVLASTNVALPKTTWTVIATNLLSGTGNFTLTITNAVSPGIPRKFFMLSTTNNL